MKKLILILALMFCLIFSVTALGFEKVDVTMVNCGASTVYVPKIQMLLDFGLGTSTTAVPLLKDDPALTVYTTSSAVSGTVQSVVIKQTMGAVSAADMQVLRVTLASEYQTGSSVTAIYGKIDYGDKGDAAGGMASGICAEINFPTEAIGGGTYTAFDAEIQIPDGCVLIDSATAFPVSFFRAGLWGADKSEFDEHGYLLNLNGLEDLDTYLWSENTLRILIGTNEWYLPMSSAQASYTTAYPVSSTSTIKYGVTGSGLTVSDAEDYVSEFFSSSDTGAQAYAMNVGTMYVRHDIDAGCELDSNSYVSAGLFRMEIAGAADLSATNGPWVTALMGYLKNPSGVVDANSNICSAVNGLVNVGADYFSNAPAALYTCAFVAASYSNASADINNYPAYLVYDLGLKEFTHGLWVGMNSATTAVGMGTVTNAFEFPAQDTAPTEAHIADENSTGRIKILVGAAVRYLYYYD